MRSGLLQARDQTKGRAGFVFRRGNDEAKEAQALHVIGALRARRAGEG